jgi:hypothetical protein
MSAHYRVTGERAEDIAILHCFSSRLYGFRKYQKIALEGRDWKPIFLGQISSLQ